MSVFCESILDMRDLYEKDQEDASPAAVCGIDPTPYPNPYPTPYPHPKPTSNTNTQLPVTASASKRFPKQ